MKHHFTFLAAVFLSILFIGFRGTAQIISTAAGNGIAGYSGNGGNADSAKMSAPAAVITDGSGNVYISDYNNNVVRKVSTSGIITVVAGTGGFGGYNGDGIPATTAKLNGPDGLAIDIAGNLYIADNGNFRVRMIDTAGIIHTVAGIGGVYGFGCSGDGGAATSAHIYAVGIAVDQYQNLYIADGNYAVRKVTHATGIITTVAGNGSFGYNGDGEAATSAALANPTGVAVDGAGNIYIADYTNNRVRMVNTSSVISTIAGTGRSGFSGDGVATANNLYMPYAVTLDASGNIFISDQADNRIREVNAAGMMTTYAGGGAMSIGDEHLASCAQLNTPAGISVDASGNLYIADQGNNRIRMIALPTYICAGTTTTLDGSSIWISSATSVATIDSFSGVVTGISAGNAIMYQIAGGDTLATSVIVNPLPDAGIMSGPDSVSVGDTINLSETVTTGIWGNNNITVATLLSTAGVIGLSPGVDTIFFLVADNNCSATTSFAVTVWQVPTVVSTGTGTTTGTGSTGTSTVSGTGSTTVTGTGSVGTTTVAGTDSTSATTTGTTTATEAVKNVTAANNTVTVYPNPSSGLFNINLSAGTAAVITVCDMHGNIVMTKDADAQTTALQINLQDMPRATYLLRVQSDNNSFVQKIVLQ